MKAILLIGLGGGLGSILRYTVGILTQRMWSLTFPLGTLTVNLLGSLFIGLLYGWIAKNTLNANLEVQWLAITGFCGGFTTYSAFSFDTLTLIEKGQHTWAIGYVLSTLTLGLVMVYLGYWLIHKG